MKHSLPVQYRNSAWLLALLLFFCGCAKRDVSLHEVHKPAPPFSEGGQVHVPDRWWTEFGDRNLNSQVDHSLRDNFSLGAALHRLTAARAVVRREASDLWPDVDGFSEFNSFLSTENPDRTEFVLGSDMSYQVDLWGQIRSRIRAERFRAEATREDYEALGLTLSAEVAATWFSLIEANAQLDLLNKQLLTNRTGLELQEARWGQGLIRSPDVVRQRQLVESTREQIVVVQSQVEVLEHRLAILQGQPPQQASYQPGNQLPMLPSLPQTGVPSELVNRRPDVRSAFYALQAADRDLASAITAQYPRLNLAATVTTATESAENLFQEWALSLGSQLIGPIIDGGQRRAEVHRNNAVVRQRLDEYRQVVLVAFREVEDALAREYYQRERIERLEDQLKYAREATSQLREQYVTGDVDFLDLLNATTAEQRLQRETLSARLELILNRIELYLALAGGIQPHSHDSHDSFPPEKVDDD